MLPKPFDLVKRSLKLTDHNLAVTINVIRLYIKRNMHFYATDSLISDLFDALLETPLSIALDDLIWGYNELEDSIHVSNEFALKMFYGFEFDELRSYIDSLLFGFFHSDSESLPPSIPKLFRALNTPFMAVPAPRLVGIEPNPGPPTKAQLQAQIKLLESRGRGTTTIMTPAVFNDRYKQLNLNKSGKLVSSSSSSHQPKKPKARKPRRGPPSRKSMSTANRLQDTYNKSLADPFEYSPPRLGFGTFLPSTLQSGYDDTTVSMGSTDTCFAIIIRPGSAVNSTTNSTLRTYSAIVPSTILSSGTVSSNTYKNAATLLSLGDTFRVLSSGARVRVTIPATAMPGSLYCGHIPDDALVNVEGLTFSALLAKNFMRRCQGLYAGVTWRPADPSDLTFSVAAGSGIGVSSATHCLVIAGIGFPAAAFNVYLDYVTHFESLQGVDDGLGVTNDGDEPTLSEYGVTIEQSVYTALRSAGSTTDTGPTPSLGSQMLGAAFTAAKSNRGMGLNNYII